MAGLDVAIPAQRAQGHFAVALAGAAVQAPLVEEGRLGQKTGKGLVATGAIEGRRHPEVSTRSAPGAG